MKSHVIKLQHKHIFGKAPKSLIADLIFLRVKIFKIVLLMLMLSNCHHNSCRLFSLGSIFNKTGEKRVEEENTNLKMCSKRGVSTLY